MAFFADVLSSCRANLKKTPITIPPTNKPPEESGPINLLNHELSDREEETEPLPSGVRLVIISDTHGKHEGEIDCISIHESYRQHNNIYTYHLPPTTCHLPPSNCIEKID
jgi:hypothetical protein